MIRWTHRHPKSSAASCAFWTILVLALHFSYVAYQQAEHSLRNQLIRFGKRAERDPNLVYLALDEPSMDVVHNASPEEIAASPALGMMSQGWPWPRPTHALILERLVKAGARVVAFDLLFPTPREGDELFRDALDRYRDCVVVGGNFMEDNQAVSSTRNFVPPAPTLIQDATHDDRVGFVNFWPDPNEIVVREVRYRVTASQVFRTPPMENETVFESITARMLRKIGRTDLIPDGVKVFRFAGSGDEGGFLPESVYKIFVPAIWENNYKNGEFFRDKVVLIGQYGNFMKDQLPTPFGLMWGPEIHLNALNAALKKDFITTLSIRGEFLLIAGAGLAALLLSWFVLQPILRFLLLIGLSGLFAVVAGLLYNRFGTLILVMSPMVAFTGSGLTALAWQSYLERKEKAQMRRTMERYMSKNLVRDLLDNPATFFDTLGGVRKPVAIMFTDLRGFTTMTEGIDSQEIVCMLNEYFTEMVKHVFANSGTLDKFIGDAIMAVWGNVVSEGPARDVELAVITALAMRESLAKLNEQWLARGSLPLAMGCGINYGEAIVGNIGSPEKMELTVIGDAVNLASRLEGLSKQYGTDMVLGQGAAELARDSFHLQYLDLVRVKGKRNAIEVYGVIGPRNKPLEAATASYLDVYAQGIQKYRARDFAGALESFRESLTIAGADVMAQLYINRCLELLKNPPDESWDGIMVMTTK